MYLLHNGIEYHFNREESQKAIETSAQMLENLMSQCRENHCETYYLILLIAMKSLCESQLESFGNDGIEAMFANRVYLNSASED